MSSDLSKGVDGRRLPRNHSTILEAVQAAPGTHLTAQDVFVRARAAQPRIGFATVHRALTRLHEAGYLLKVDVPGVASAVYERNVPPHSHFRCTRCGTIQDVEFSVAPTLLAELATRYGLDIATESTTFAGSCATCAAI